MPNQAVTDLTHYESGATRAKVYTDDEITSLAGIVVGAINEERPSPATFTLPASGWALDSNEASIYVYYYDLAVAGVTADDIPHAAIERAGMAAAEACGLCPSIETINGAVRFRAAKVPASAIAGYYWIQTKRSEN